MPPNNPPAYIEIFGGDAVITGADLTSAEQLLGYDVHHFQAGGKTGCQWTRQRENAVVRGPDGPTILAGLVPRVRAILESQGQAVEVRDHRGDRRPLKVNQYPLEQITPQEQQLQEAVIGHRQGQITIPRDSDRIGAIASICSLFTQAHVLILATTREQVRDLHRKLEIPLRFNVGLQLGWSRISRLPQVVATYASRMMRDKRRWDIVIHAFPEQLVQKQAFRDAMECGGPRVYGISQANQALPRRTQLIVEGICGPVIHEVPDLRGRRADVTVNMVKSPWVPSPGELPHVERKRQMFWSNDIRNTAIADIAMAFTAGNAEPLWEHGLFLSDEHQHLLTPNRRVTIAVESPQHGRQLLRRLPGWRLLDGNLPAKNLRQANTNMAVITMVAADRLRQLDTDVLIWAVGGRAIADFDGFPPRRRYGDPRNVLLIDLADDFDNTAIADTQTRLSVYRDRMWDVYAPQSVT